ncbi:Imm50 family immunity protein [Streptomyces sp. NBC_00503]|uniref:Imm50 family immunity protein n=1 Tax=Streptomyces sp. NBC_00503 TaxID=2903659 RepID=UPI002E814C1C|nr:Imm50 family immunity protein [Streptomyces sp. NBC_00503]WUD84045.1 immunity 50 family protein [Streptomyces sp. NBC_00503]
MTASNEWPELRALYGTVQVPDLNTCGFFYVHVDERETSVTFGFETSQLPSHPKPEWSGKPYNTLRFFVEFTDVTNLRMAGIVAEAERRVRIGRGASDCLDVAVAGDRREISFSAAASRVTHIRVELQGSL